MTMSLTSFLRRGVITATVAMCSVGAQASDGLTPAMINELDTSTAHFERHEPTSDESLITQFYSDETVTHTAAQPPAEIGQVSHCSGCGQPPISCGCEVASCDSRSCDDSGVMAGGFLERFKKRTKCCTDPWWTHRTGGFGEFLYLSPGSSDFIHAIEVTDPDPDVATPTGPVGIVDMTAQPGFRVGFTLAASKCSSLSVGYTRWDGDGSSVLGATGANVLESQAVHSSLLNSGSSSLEERAQHDMSFQLIDVNYRHLWKQTGATAVNWLGGLRYGKMEQDLTTAQTVQVATGLTTVDTDIDFEGFGINGGLDLERYSQNTGLFIYGRGMASLMAGDWKATYRQTNTTTAGGVPANNYEDFHATPILEGELGLGWMRPCGRIRLQTGYMMSAWYESVSTRGYIEAVRDANLVDIGETITFSGLTTRLSILF